MILDKVILVSDKNNRVAIYSDGLFFDGNGWVADYEEATSYSCVSAEKILATLDKGRIVDIMLLFSIEDKLITPVIHYDFSDYDSFNEALFEIQTGLGVTTGDVAAQFFSGRKNNLGLLNIVQKRRLLMQYILVEFLFME